MSGGVANGELDALDELAVDCYVYIFIKRLRSLLAQLETKSNIDGLVIRNVRNFVHEAQRRHDPLGFRVFQVFRRAVEEGVADRRLFILDDHRHLFNEMLVGFQPETDIPEHGDDAIDLSEIVARWNDSLLSELVTARGNKLSSVIDAFKNHLLALENEGVRCFRCREVVEPLKKDARNRWATLWSHGDGSQLVCDDERRPRALAPASEMDSEAKERFAALAQCVENKLEEFDGQRRTRNHLKKLWDYLKHFAAPDVEGGQGGMSWEDMEESLPSQRELAKRLGIPRERFPDLYEVIRTATQGCLGTSVAGPVKNRAPSTPPCAERRVMEDRRDDLLQRTGEAFQRLQEDKGSALAKGTMRSGKLYALAESSDLGVEWLALEAGKEGCWRMIPGDPHPWLGSADWELTGNGLGPLTLRCAEDYWLDARIFDDAVETAVIDTAQLEALTEHLETLSSAASRAEDAQLEDDEDPEYRAWCQRLKGIGHTLSCRRMSEESDAKARQTAPQQGGASLRGFRSRGLGDGFLARAALIFLAVGVAHWSGRWVVGQADPRLGEGGGQQENLQRQLASLKEENQHLDQRIQELASGSIGGSHDWTLISGERVRSEPTEISLSEGKPLVGLLLELPPLVEGDWLEISPVEGGDAVWRDERVGVDDTEEKNLITVPAAALSDGGYVLKVLRDLDGDIEEIFVQGLKVTRL